ncbi:hypothetical protein PIB30_062540 [Stylosanthes scabra]|uniref:Oleosin n=1 Tax=Stylosanthes scabra TaxID=79078 RepID=A0ABU6TMU5_9FABA|nr:hypothetical protein [Stylosanthes scabra]
MAETQQQYYYNVNHPTTSDTITNSTASLFLTLAILLPLGAFLFLLSGFTLALTITAIILAAPLFLIFSPLLLSLAALLAFVLTGFVASGALYVAGILTFEWLAGYLRRIGWSEQLEQAKRWTNDVASHVAKRTKEPVMSKSQE